MTIRTPLKNDSGNVKEMSSAEVTQIVNQKVYHYSLNPSVSLSVVNSGGSLGTITDTRLQAGAMVQTNSSFPDEATTDEPSIVTVNYDKVSQTIASVSATSDTGTTFPAYYNAGGQVQAMSLSDVKDTFLHPAIDLLTAGGIVSSQQGGTYHINTTSSISGSTLVSATPIFLDTRADTSLYTAGGIGETLDQPTTIQNYYLHRVNGVSSTPTLSEDPLFIDSNNNIREYTASAFNTLIQGWIRYTAASSSDGYAISYNIGASGSGSVHNRGSGIVDTKLNGSTYATRQVSDDYRSQEFPSGSATTIATYFLRIHKS